MDPSIAAVQVFSNSTLDEILDDLCVRFILYLPDEELSSVERICFQIEEAHWFYEDFIREINPGLPNVNLRTFIHQIFSHIPQSLISHIPLWKTENAFADFMVYKTRVPVRGAIMLNTAMDQVVLVKGWKSGSSWSFPRGKIDQNEGDLDCAVREVLEETGYNLAGTLREGDFVEMNIREQNMRLYIATGVSEGTLFQPKTRKEISKIAWHNLSDLPGYKKGGKNEINQVRSGKFYMVAPFIRELRKWISTSGKQWLKEQQTQAVSQQYSLASAAANIAPVDDETDVEGDVFASPPTVSNDSTAGLRSLLGIEKAAEVVEHGHMTSNQQEEASRRLKEMLNLNTPSEPSGNAGRPKPLLNGNQSQNKKIAPTDQPPNAQALLSMLQSGSPAPAPSEGTMAVPHPASQNVLPGRHTPSTSVGPPYPQGIQQRMPLAPVIQNPAPPQHYNGWARGPGFPGNVPQLYHQPNHHLPSPPPTGMFRAPPPSGNYLMHQQRNSMPPVQNYNSAPLQPPYPVPTGIGAQLPTSIPSQQPPLTPMEGFLPPAVPTRPPDPGQTGALLSILKGGSGPPAQVPKPQPQPSPSVPDTSTANPPAQPSKPIALQAPPPPRGPKSQTPRMKSVANFSNEVPRPSTSAPPRQTFAPPARPISAQPPSHRPTPRPISKTPQSPVVIDYYGTPKSSTLPRANFDRRDSVSNERASTLLSMFRKPGASSPAPPAVANGPPRAAFDRRDSVSKERANTLLAMFRSPSTPPVADGSAIASSPEVEKVAPTVPVPQPNVGQRQSTKAKSPLGKEKKDDLWRYLEGVAKLG